MTIWYRSRFLFCSFGPLYLLLLAGLLVQHDWAKSWQSLEAAAVIISALAFTASIPVFLMLRKNFTRGPLSRYKVEPLDALDENIMSYMLSYFPPLMIDDFTSTAKVAPTAVFYAVFLLIFSRSEALYVNPYFLIFGYRIFRVRMPSGRLAIVITKKKEIPLDRVIDLYEVQPSKIFFAK